MLKRVQTCLYFLNLFKQVWTYSNLFKLVQTFPSLFKLVQTCSNLPKFFENCPILLKLTQTFQVFNLLVCPVRIFFSTQFPIFYSVQLFFTCAAFWDWIFSLFDLKNSSNCKALGCNPKGHKFESCRLQYFFYPLLNNPVHCAK